MKQTHRKVRSGCGTCRQRRVKCDELKPECTQCRRIRYSRSQPVHCHYDTLGRDVHGTNSTEGQGAGEGAGAHTSLPATQPVTAPSPSLYMPGIRDSEHGWGTITAQERELLYHVCMVRQDFQNAASLGLFVGINNFAKYLPMAAKFEYIQNCLCAVSAAHLSSLYQSADMKTLECHYRVLAIQGMANDLAAMNNETGALHKEKVEALIGATKMMAWYTPDAREYSQLLNGTYALFSKLQPSRHPSDANAATATSNNADQFRNVDLDSTVKHRLDQASETLASLSRCNLQPEVNIAVKELANFIYNIRRFSWKAQSVVNQLFAMFPIRNWMQWMPRANEYLAANDLPTMVCLANYETVMLTMCSLFPGVGTPFAVGERYLAVNRLRGVIRDRVSILAEGGACGDHPAYIAGIKWLVFSEVFV